MSGRSIFFGNDVVDLADVRRSPWTDRALRRLFREEELAGLSVSRHIEELGALWAAKEAAYKAVKRCRPAKEFVWHAFIVERDLSSVSCVEPGDGERLRLGLKITQDKTKDYVHALCCGPEISRGYAWIRETGRLGPGEESAAVRATLSRGLRELLGPARTAHMSILGGGEIPPLLRLAPGDAAIPISLSHDGRFVAAAMPMPEQTRTAEFASVGAPTSVDSLEVML